jgi:excisionase family DNA binding protein
MLRRRLLDGTRGEFSVPDGDPLAVGDGLAPRLVTVAVAAKLLGISRSTLYELIAAGEVEVVHIRRSARVAVADIDAYVDRLRAAGGAGVARSS